MGKHYVNLPFKLKDKAKDLYGAKWDDENKSWYINNDNFLELFDIVDISVPFYCKDIAKDNGCIWSKEHKIWKTSKFNEDNINELVKRELKHRVIE